MSTFYCGASMNYDEEIECNNIWKECNNVRFDVSGEYAQNGYLNKVIIKKLTK